MFPPHVYWSDVDIRGFWLFFADIICLVYMYVFDFNIWQVSDKLIVHDR